MGDFASSCGVAGWDTVSHQKCLELDGPPCAYFTVQSYPDGDRVVCIQYEEVAPGSDDEKAIKAEARRQQQLIKDFVAEKFGILWWRTRPEFSVEKAGTRPLSGPDFKKRKTLKKNRWSFYMRFA